MEPRTNGAPPRSTRTYLPGRLHPDLRVPFRLITLSPTHSFNGKLEDNESVRVYDCSGPWGDESFHGDVKHGLPPLRRDWILRRGDVEKVPGRAAGTVRAKPGGVVTQMRYARQGVITPEM